MLLVTVIQESQNPQTLNPKRYTAYAGAPPPILLYDLSCDDWRDWREDCRTFVGVLSVCTDWYFYI